MATETEEDGHPGASEKRLVVAHVLPRLSPGGGIQVVVRNIADRIDASQFELHVITFRPNWDSDTTDELPLTLHALGFTGGRFRYRDRLRLMVETARTVRRLRADVVHLHNGTTWLGLAAIGTSRRTRFILEVHDGPGSGRQGVWADWLDGLLVRRFGVVPACHSTHVASAIEGSWRVPRSRIQLFPLGIDVDQFVPAGDDTADSWRSGHGLRPESLVLVAVGRPVPSKRFDLAIELVARSREIGADVELVLIGAGASAELAAQVTRLGLGEHVHLWGFEDDLPAALAACDILLSTSEYEGFGLTIAEGMACGLPVLATAVGGVTDLVADGTTGFLVPAGDVAALADHVSSLADDPNLCATLGPEGRRRAEELFRIDTMVAHFSALYRDLT